MLRQLQQQVGLLVSVIKDYFMKAKYSPSNKGVYPTDIFQTFPEDALDIPDVLLKKFRNGKIMGFDVQGGIVIEFIPVVSLADIKRDKKIEINDAFNAELQNGFITTSGIKLNTDKAAIQDLKFLYDMAIVNNQTTFTIIDFDENNLDATPLADVLVFIKELSAHYQSLIDKKQSLRNQIKDAQNKNQVNLITWS
jgi:hypothetical protein